MILMMSTKVSIVHPSRNRPTKSANTLLHWIQDTGIPLNEIEIILSLDEDDHTINEYKKQYEAFKDVQLKILVNRNRSAVDAVNVAAKESTGDIIVVVSDDFLPAVGWARAIIRARGDLGEFVLKVSDGVQRWIITLPILSRSYYLRYGYIYPPEFLHMFADTMFTHQAEVDKVIVRREDLKFSHRHYSITRDKKDDVTLKADRTWNQGKAEYLKQVTRKFGKLPNWGLKSTESKGHAMWLDKCIFRHG